MASEQGETSIPITEKPLAQSKAPELRLPRPPSNLGEFNRRIINSWLVAGLQADKAERTKQSSSEIEHLKGQENMRRAMSEQLREVAKTYYEERALQLFPEVDFPYDCDTWTDEQRAASEQILNEVEALPLQSLLDRVMARREDLEREYKEFNTRFSQGKDFDSIQKVDLKALDLLTRELKIYLPKTSK